MVVVNLIDTSAELTGVSYTDEGYMVGVVKCARTGLQDYHSSELGLMGDSIIQVNRSEQEVFSEDSRKTYSHAPVTMGHPTENVTAKNWDELAVGEVSTDVKFEAGWVHVPIIVKAADAIAKIKDGIREISMGYGCQIAFADGKYEQTNIKINHLAFVDKARAGSQARIGDDARKWGAAPITTEDHMADLITVVVGDKAVQMSVLDAATFEAFRTSIIADHKAEIDAKDTEIGKLKAENAETAKAVLDDGAIELLVADRMAVTEKAKTLVKDFDGSGKSISEMKRMAVQSVYGDEAAHKDVSDAEISGIFSIMKPEKINDNVRKAIKGVTQDSGVNVLDQIAKNNGWVK